MASKSAGHFIIVCFLPSTIMMDRIYFNFSFSKHTHIDFRNSFTSVTGYFIVSSSNSCLFESLRLHFIKASVVTQNSCNTCFSNFIKLVESKSLSSKIIWAKIIKESITQFETVKCIRNDGRERWTCDDLIRLLFFQYSS